MHYVKQFRINGVDTKQVACIELQGAPNAATEGAVGVLGIDVTSPTHDVYKCVAVNGSIYTWELLSAGMSIISATTTCEGALTATFLYTDLRIPKGYIFKVGDLVLDCEGYLYQISALGAKSCDTEYCGIYIGGSANGCNGRLVVKDGLLKLVTESGRVLSQVDYLKADGTTIYREQDTGVGRILGIRTINGGVLRFFVGTQEVYESLTEEQQEDLFALITDDTFKQEFDTLKVNFASLTTTNSSGEIVAKKAMNVNTLINADVGSNANVKFTIGDKTFSKTVNNVAKANRATNVEGLSPTDIPLADNARSTIELSTPGLYAVQAYVRCASLGFYTVFILPIYDLYSDYYTYQCAAVETWKGQIRMNYIRIEPDYLLDGAQCIEMSVRHDEGSLTDFKIEKCTLLVAFNGGS